MDQNALIDKLVKESPQLLRPRYRSECDSDFDIPLMGGFREVGR